MNDIKKKFENTAELYRIELCKLWNIKYEDTYWIGDYTGGTLDVRCELPLSYDDIRYIVDNKIEEETVRDWLDYIVAVEGIKSELYNINLQHWCMGCPRVDASKWYNELWAVKNTKKV